MSAPLIQRLVDIAREAALLPHGKRSEFYDKAAAELGMSTTTLHRKLKDVTVKKTRKQRSDAGKSVLPREEAELISALLLESIRRNNKQLSTIDRAVERLRANGLILAGRVDAETGEFVPLSSSAISRALRSFVLHPEQLLQPAPAVELASKHPNHVWQIDASLSTQFYMSTAGAAAIDRTQYYDGKPENLKKIERQRLWRYVITDHASGAIYVEYVLGAESAENICNVLINAIQKRGKDPFHGAPLMIMTDPGAAMTSAIFRNLCRALSIELIINKVGNARAKGQVEQAHNIVECEFESGLKLRKAESLDDINALATKWMIYYNATSVHSRTRRTRYAVWLTIKPEQLRLAPPIEVCKELAISEPEERKVTPKLRVSFRGTEFDVSQVPDVLVGQKLLVTRNPWRDADSAQIVLTGDDGREIFYVVDRVEKSELGFATASPHIGDAYKQHKDTPAQVARKTLEQIATGTNSVEAAEIARKSKAVPFAGRIDPYKHVEDTVIPDHIPKRGTELEVNAPIVELPKLNPVQLAKQLAAQMGSTWNGAEHFAWLKQRYPEGAAEDQLQDIMQLLQTINASPLRVVK